MGGVVYYDLGLQMDSSFWRTVHDHFKWTKNLYCCRWGLVVHLIEFSPTISANKSIPDRGVAIQRRWLGSHCHRHYHYSKYPSIYIYTGISKPWKQNEVEREKDGEGEGGVARWKNKGMSFVWATRFTLSCDQNTYLVETIKNKIKYTHTHKQKKTKQLH